LSSALDVKPRAAGARTPFPWEKHYPPGVAWDAPIEPGTVPDLFARGVAAHKNRTAIEFRDRPIAFAELGRAVDAMAAAFFGAASSRKRRSRSICPIRRSIRSRFSAASRRAQKSSTSVRSTPSVN